tara:strand:+ start:430 stop:1689 length:1260 start_codon:yes stop_codon:yes gene_type:complete
MATVGLIQTTVSVAVSSTSTSFTEVVESSALVSGKTYYVICHALCEGALSSAPDSFRLVDRTNSDTVLSNSTMVREPSTADSTESYYFIGRFTAGSGGGGLAFEQKSSINGFTVSTQYLSMLLLDLSNLASGDFFYANNSSDTELTDTYQTFATTTPATTASDDWLVLGWQATATDVVNAYSTNVQLNSDIDHDNPTSQMEGEDLTEVLNVLQGRTYVASGGTDTWSIKSKMHTAGAVLPNNHLESTLIGFRLNAFTDYAKDFTSAELTTTGTGFEQYATTSFDPTSTEDVVVFGASLFHAGGTARPCRQRIQIDGTTSPNTQPNTENAGKSKDTVDILPLSYVTKYTPSGSSKVIDLDCLKTTSADIGFSKRALCAFSTEITSTNQVFTAVASQTYNGGDVAGQTFASGDVASEVQPT